MNNTGRHGEKSGYLVILLLLVGLTAFSQSMKELTDIHHLTLDASRLIAQWSGNVTPAEVPPVQVATIEKIARIEKIESCEGQHQAASVEPGSLTAPSAVAAGRLQQRRTQRIPGEAEIAKLKKLQRVDIDAGEFEVRIPSVQFPEAGELPTSADMPSFTFKARARKHSTFRITPRDREILLKTLNRSINLRITG
jgi:hypothetical protein